MVDIPFVKQEQLLQAQAMEEALFELPESVVTFVGIVVEPTVDSEPTYYVSVGCSPSMDLGTCASSVHMQLRKRWKTENISVKAFWGKLRTN